MELIELQCVIVTAVLGVIFYVILTYYRKRKRIIELIDKIPGPKAWPLLGNATHVGLLTKIKDVHPLAIHMQHRSALCELYSNEKIVRVWYGAIPFVLFFKQESMEAVLSSSDNIEKGMGYRFLNSWLGNGLLTSKGAHWRTRRKQLSPSFHFRILQDFLPIMISNADKLVVKIREMLNDDFVPIDELLVLCTLDIICETAMGVSVNALQESNSLYVTSLRKLSILLMERYSNLLLWPDLFFALSKRGKQFFKHLNTIMDFTREVIKSRKAEMITESMGQKTDDNLGKDDTVNSRKKMAFLDTLLELHLQGKISEENVREEVDTFMFEGHDTTAFGLTWTFYLIGSHPKTQDKIHEEIDSIFADDKFREITSDDLKEMKYLECVLKESQRIFPSVPFIARTLTNDLIVDGYTVPKGTNCELLVYQLHRNPDVFPNPEVFDPDRFLMENCATRHPYAYVPFSAGPRNCIGQKFALTEEKVIVATLLRSFKIRALDPRDKITFQPELILKSRDNIRIAVTQR